MMESQHDEAAARAARAAYFKREVTKVQRVADNYAKADRSDPFTHNRVMSHYLTGTCHSLDDYAVEFRTEERTLPNGGTFSDGSHSFSVEVPCNQKRL